MMENNRCAVVDLGTNTFHLIIADCQSNSWHVIHKEKQYVSLGADGLGHISNAAYHRAEKTLIEFSKIIISLKVNLVKAYGTAALRSADNRTHFIDKMYQLSGIQIQVIDGITEANFIHQGVLAENISKEDSFVIMDIGGGSVEYIHSQDAKSQKYFSFNTGIAELNKLFPPEDPIEVKTLDKINLFLKDQMSEMTNYWARIQPSATNTLYGASGSFEIIFKMLTALKIPHEPGLFKKAQFDIIYDMIISSTLKERSNMAFLPVERRVLIVSALVLIKFVMEKFYFEKIRYASYALKEGALSALCGCHE